MSDSRFCIAVHILAGLTIVKILNREAGITSDRIAWSVNLSPERVDAMLRQLHQAGLVDYQDEARLKGDPRRITLLDIYQAVENGQVAFPQHTPNPDCPVGSNLFMVLKPALNAAQLALHRELHNVTIEQVARGILVLTGHRTPAPQPQYA